MKTDTKFLNAFKAARRVSTPLIAVQTPDAAATIHVIAEAINGTQDGAPIAAWDVVNGLVGLNEVGKQTVKLALRDRDQTETQNPVGMLTLITEFPKKSVIFFLNAHRFVCDPATSQAVWNLRDLFKEGFRQLVMLAPSIELPDELRQDVLVMDEPLPNAEELALIVADAHEAAKIPQPSDKDVRRCVDALSGLAAFAAEQVTAMSLTKEGIDHDGLWERKRQTIEQTPGLSVHRGGLKFSDLGGLDNAKQFFTRVINGERPPNGIVFIDEIEKALAGAQGDTSGVSQDMMGTLLTEMQEKQWTGVIAIGPPGSGKSALSAAVGNEAGKPTIITDLSGMKDSLVGRSGQNLRAALKVIDAVTGGRVLAIATCNALGILPPELRRRFTFGTFFFDLPSKAERAAIWKLYLKQFGLLVRGGEPKGEDGYPDDEGWTGAEIRQCCDLAYRLRCSLVEASAYIVPVAVSAAEQIEKLRMQASGRFISASTPGKYRYDPVAVATPLGAKVMRSIAGGDA